MARNIVKTNNGKTIDIGALAAKNSGMIAAGNGRLNARGDLLGQGGKVVKTIQEQVTEYNDKNPKAVERVTSLNTPLEDALNFEKEEATVAETVSVPAAKVENKVTEKPKSDIENLKKFDVGVSVDETKTSNTTKK